MESQKIGRMPAYGQRENHGKYSAGAPAASRIPAVLRPHGKE